MLINVYILEPSSMLSIPPNQNTGLEVILKQGCFRNSYNFKYSNRKRSCFCVF